MKNTQIKTEQIAEVIDAKLTDETLEMTNKTLCKWMDDAGIFMDVAAIRHRLNIFAKAGILDVLSYGKCKVYGINREQYGLLLKFGIQKKENKYRRGRRAVDAPVKPKKIVIKRTPWGNGLIGKPGTVETIGELF